MFQGLSILALKSGFNLNLAKPHIKLLHTSNNWSMIKSKSPKNLVVEHFL